MGKKDKSLKKKEVEQEVAEDSKKRESKKSKNKKNSEVDKINLTKLNQKNSVETFENLKYIESREFLDAYITKKLFRENRRHLDIEFKLYSTEEYAINILKEDIEFFGSIKSTDITINEFGDN